MFGGFEQRLVLLPVLALVIAIHEWAHAYVALKLGDPTAKSSGRVSLNPLNHLDPLGTAMLLFVGFGWGKPVPINPAYFKNPRRDQALVALAGPLSNILMAVVFSLILKVFFTQFFLLASFIKLLVILNLGLAFFNLVPAHPLDGFKVVLGILPQSLVYDWMEMSKYGVVILLVFLFTPLFDFLVMGPVSFFARLLL